MISVASSIKFRKQDSQEDSFDNVQLNEESFRGGYMAKYLQKVYTTDELTIQVKVKGGNTIVVYSSLNCWGAWTSYTTGTLEGDYTLYDYYEAVLDMSDFAATSVQFKVEVVDGSTLIETWISEPVKILSTTDENLMTIEYFNSENAFEVDYSTGIAHLLRVEAQLKEYKPGGEMSVLDNQDEVTKIRDEVKRILVLKTEPIPRYLAEMLRVAVAMDNFFVNEVEFVAESLPEVDNTPGNLVTWTCSLTQRNVIGLNTHDIGFDCDSITDDMVIVLQNATASGAVSFTVPLGYKVCYITGVRSAGSPVITAGRAPAGTDILTNMSLNATTNVYSSADVSGKLMNATKAAATLYVNVAGVGAVADICVTLIKDIPA